MSPRPYLRLLGGARIDNEHENSPIRGRAAHRRRLALLAILAASPGYRASRERLIALLWPERGPETARKHLSEALHVIRRELGDTVLDAVGDEVSLDPRACGADVIDFRAAIAAQDYPAAVERYAGPFLDAWFVEGAQSFDEWAQGERIGLEELYLRAREVLASAAERERDWRGALEHLAAMTRLRPESAALALRQARCLAASGDRGGAVRALQAHAARVEAAELPVDPAVPAFEARLRSSHTPTEPAFPVPDVPDAPALPQMAAEDPQPADRSQHTIATRAAGGLGSARVPRLGWIASAAALVLILGWLATRGRAAALDRPLDARRLAVLYFEHDARDGLGYLADGLTLRMIDELSSVPELRVASRTAVLHFRQREQMPTLDSVAAALGAAVLVEGRVERVAEDVRVSVGLVDARSLARIGAPQIVVRPATGPVFALQDDVATALALLLRRQLGLEYPVVVSRSGTTSASAREATDRAAHERNLAWALVERGTANDLAAAATTLRRADSLLAVAERLDRRWSEPTIERGWVARDLARLAGDHSADAWLDSAVSRADRALASGADSASVLELRGTARWQRVVRDAGHPDAAALRAVARADLERALALDSSRVRGAAALAQLTRVTARTLDERRAA
ncbi:MAG: hypothetical protein IT457_18665, partial [Planctomycetes bacterium]|nr:hypothetical protein [Planctomycetota bacterium]